MTRVFLTGATGGMGSAGLAELVKDEQNVVTALVRPSAKNRRLMERWTGHRQVQVRWGDLTSYDDVEACVRGADIVLHVGAFVSPEADYHPGRAMAINYGSTVNILAAIKRQPDPDAIRLVYIGTIAETGDRLPPIHWGRVGDPLKPSVHDYYAVSKIAAERAVIESGLRYWVSLRQTGILSLRMLAINDGIMFHNPLDNVLEYVTDHDSGVLLRNVCREVPEGFWGHVYNIGGGPGCRISTTDLMRRVYGVLGLRHLEYALDARWYATRNFHGHYYLDSQRLEEILHFRSETLEDFYARYDRALGHRAKLSRLITRLPGGERLVGAAMRRRFEAVAMTDHGPLSWIRGNRTELIDPFFISREAWSRIPPLPEVRHFTDWETVVRIDHGYDETKPEAELSLADMRGAAAFRGGQCLAGDMTAGDMTTPLPWRCAFGHDFLASPRLVLEGGHWCPDCERASWSYQAMAKVNPFFAQVWYPLHDRDEPVREYRKEHSELDVPPPESTGASA